MYMSKEPRRINLSEERVKVSKGKQYTQFNAYDPECLEEYEELILSKFASNPELQALLKANMDKVTEFIIGDRLNSGVGVSASVFNSDGSRQIHMDTLFFDERDNTFTVKPDCDYFDTLVVDALLHVAAGKKGNLTGVLERERNAEGKSTGKKKNSGLNEGITQYIAEAITGKKIPEEANNYSFNTEMVSLLADVLGPGLITNAYFGDSNTLKDAMNALAQDPEYYDKFNRDLDTINKLQTTVKRIKNGSIKPKDPESLAKMETVLKAQQERLVESVFANIIIPQIQSYKVENKNIAATKDLRQSKLLPILKKHEELLRIVAKYISPSLHSEFVSDQALSAIQKEVRENGINFAKIAEASRKIDESKKTATVTANKYTEEVNKFYIENEQALNSNRTTQLSPFLKRELQQFLKIYDQLKEIAEKNGGPTVESFNDYDRWFRAHFSKIPNLDEEIAKIRVEEQVRQQAARTEEPAELKAAREAGRKAGEEALGGKKEEQQEPKKQPSEPEKPKRQEDTSVLSKKFVASDLSGQVFDQRNLSLYEKAMNYANATGEGISPDDTLLVEMRNKSVEKYMSSLPNNPPKALYAVYGDRWREVLAQAYAEGYRQGMASRLNEATQKGMEQRAETKNAILNGKPLEEPKRSMDLEELKFVHETFEIVSFEDGYERVINKSTKQPVLSERTMTGKIYAEEWVATTGIEQDDHTLEAFTPKHAEMFENFNAVVRSHIKEDGQLDIDSAMEELASKGEGYKAISDSLLGDQEHIRLTSEFITLNAKKEELVNAPKTVEHHRPEQPLTDLTQVLTHVTEATEEEINSQLNIFNGAPIKQEDGRVYYPFNDPVTAAKLNTRYLELTGEDHPVFVQHAPSLIEGLLKDKDSLASSYPPDYFDKLTLIKGDLESRHPELVQTEQQEKKGHR